MREKIRLEMEELAVDSFATVDGDSALRGTVHGRDCSYTRDPQIECQERTVSGTWPCECISAGEEYSCDSTCNPHQCDCQSYPCATVDCG
jgi:hypothetical protein